MAKVDEKGDLLHIGSDGLVKLDGVTIFRKISRSGKLFLQFQDRDRMRTRLRKTAYIEIPIDVLIRIITETFDASELLQVPAEIDHHESTTTI